MLLGKLLPWNLSFTTLTDEQEHSFDAAVELPPEQQSLALASMARDDPPASSTASSTVPASSTAAAMRAKVGSEFET